MNMRTLLTVFVPVGALALLGGCATTGTTAKQLSADRDVVAESGVPEETVRKVDSARPLEVGDVVELAEAEVPTPLIRRAVERGDGRYALQTADVNRLQEAGVDEKIIDLMLARRPESGRYGLRGGYAYPYLRGFHGYRRGYYGGHRYLYYRHH